MNIIVNAIRKLSLRATAKQSKPLRLLRAIALAMTFACNHIYYVYYSYGSPQSRRGRKDKFTIWDLIPHFQIVNRSTELTTKSEIVIRNLYIILSG